MVGARPRATPSSLSRELIPSSYVHASGRTVEAVASAVSGVRRRVAEEDYRG